MTADPDIAPDALARAGAAVARARRVVAALADPVVDLRRALAAAQATGSWVPALAMLDVDPFAGIRTSGGPGGPFDEPSGRSPRRSPPIRRPARAVVDGPTAPGAGGPDRRPTAIPGIVTTPSVRGGVIAGGDRDATNATRRGPGAGGVASGRPSLPLASRSVPAGTTGLAGAGPPAGGDRPDASPETRGAGAAAAPDAEPFAELATTRLDALRARARGDDGRATGRARRTDAPDMAISSTPGDRLAPGAGAHRSEFVGRPGPASTTGPAAPDRDPTVDHGAPSAATTPAGEAAGGGSEGPASRGPGFALRRGGPHAVHGAPSRGGEPPVAGGDAGGGPAGRTEVAAEDLVALVAEVLAEQARRHGVDLS